ncbi:MAG TPA: hypothetical protein VJT71_14600 [Pyrinomonadaceae bacterium]|nr:hypothetical protein [Pyrinomonadaceae bacterium]
MNPQSYASVDTRTDRLMPGDLVEVCSAAEILATLDEKGTLENLPFMPEMLAFCGRQFRVSRNAFKTCVDDGEMRQLDDTVFLEEVRCDGGAHASCDRGCLIFWKTAWLKRPSEPSSKVNRAFLRVTEEDLSELARSGGQFFCQSSEILNASRPLPWWQPKQYVWDLRYNRTPLSIFSRSFLIAIYNKVAARFNFRSWKAITGSASTNGFAPLALQPGELVRVKPLSEIKATLDAEGKNHKMLFAPAMADYCGQVMKVRDRVENIVLEATPKQRKIKDTVVLEGATCDGVCHRLCPRQSLLFWRECWLERVNGSQN